MIRLNELKLPIGAGFDDVKKAAAKTLGISISDFQNFEISRESIDSRKKDNITMIYSVKISLLGDEETAISGFPKNKAIVAEDNNYICPPIKRKSFYRPIVIGFGPAGMFASLTLAKAGLKPIILERGNDVDERTKDIKNFWINKVLNTDSNVQFGEGGAGTFSDGKLTTGIKDSRCKEVLRVLKENGAPEEILYSSKPHIGTDKLCSVVKNIRNSIIELGGEIQFGCKLTDIIVANEAVHGISYCDKKNSTYDIETDCIVLCIGHSARDTFEMLLHKGVKLEQKAFSIGARIEHRQEMINKAQYGKEWNNPLLGAADYKLSNHPLHGRGGYTFCMCPGGTVVAASSEKNGLVVNGMSEYARDTTNANSAVLVGVETKFFPDKHPLAGIKFQREIEKKAFLVGGGDYTAPAQKVGDFLKDNVSKNFGTVKPSCTTGAIPSDIRLVLPKNITDTMLSALIDFDRKLKGFCLPDAVLTVPETRSSSPVRIVRDDLKQSNLRGLYPCGEGAGYAGGIVSAAVDGMRCAEAVLTDEV